MISLKNVWTLRSLRVLVTHFHINKNKGTLHIILFLPFHYLFKEMNPVFFYRNSPIQSIDTMHASATGCHKCRLYRSSSCNKWPEEWLLDQSGLVMKSLWPEVPVLEGVSEHLGEHTYSPKCSVLAQIPILVSVTIITTVFGPRLGKYPKNVLNTL